MSTTYKYAERAEQGLIPAEHKYRYNYKGDKNRIYQKVVAQIRMEAPGSPGVNEVVVDTSKHH
jgi:hypothetical protein